MKSISVCLLSIVAITAAVEGLRKNSFAGVIANKGPGLTIDGVHAIIQVPKIAQPKKALKTDTSKGRVVIGIDPINCSASLTAGMMLSVQSNKKTSQLFYQLAPAAPIMITGIDFKVGDHISITVLAGPNNSSFAFQNMSNNQTKYYHAKGKIPLCRNNVSFVLEKVADNPLIAFSTIKMNLAYFTEETVTYPQGVAAGVGQVYNITDSTGKKLVTANVDVTFINITYVA